MDIADILTEEDQRRLVDCLAAVVGHRYGEVRIIIQGGQVRYIEEKRRYTVKHPSPDLTVITG